MSGASYDTVRVRWAKGEVLVGTPAATNSKQGFIEDSSLTSEAQAISYGSVWLAQHGTTVDQADIGIQPTRPEIVPWTGRNKGDGLRFPDRDEATERGRIHGVGFTGLRRNGEPNWTYTMGSASQERLVVAQRLLSKISQGSMRGTFGASTISPAPSYGGVSNSALPRDELPVADTDEFRLDAPYDRTKPVQVDESKAVIRIEFSCESLVGTDDSEVEVWRIAWTSSGTVISATAIDTVTWPGSVYRFTHVTELQFNHGQGFQLRNVLASGATERTVNPLNPADLTYRAGGAHNLITIQAIASTAN